MTQAKKVDPDVGLFWNLVTTNMGVHKCFVGHNWCNACVSEFVNVILQMIYSCVAKQQSGIFDGKYHRFLLLIIYIIQD